MTMRLISKCILPKFYTTPRRMDTTLDHKKAISSFTLGVYIFYLRILSNMCINIQFLIQDKQRDHYEPAIEIERTI